MKNATLLIGCEWHAQSWNYEEVFIPLLFVPKQGSVISEPKSCDLTFKPVIYLLPASTRRGTDVVLMSVGHVEITWWNMLKGLVFLTSDWQELWRREN